VLHKVGLNIYNKPWLIEPQSALNLLELWERVISRETTWRAESEESHEGYFQIQKLFANSDVVFAPIDTYQAKSFKGFDGANVAVIPVQGPLMKQDFCGDFGTATLANLFRLAENTRSVESIVLMIDSPGGTVDGTASFANAIKNSKKPTVAAVDGLAASAAYWLASSADEIIASSKTDVVGSIGTMVSWRDTTKMYENNGVVLRQYYATKSVDKNRAFNEANAGDGRMLVQEMLDPINNEFLSAVKNNRAGKLDLQTEDVLTGKTYVASKAKQTGLIDNIMSFDNAVKRSIQMAKTIRA
jgi:signal peptide peptidase SppA